jgi:hypothetical protein
VHVDRKPISHAYQKQRAPIQVFRCARILAEAQA